MAVRRRMAASSVVDAFWQARIDGNHFPEDWRDRLDFEEAYRIQLAIVARLVANGGSQVGWKVAQTSEAARKAFGFSEPIFGCVMRDGIRQSGHAYGRGGLIQPRCEPEICVRLKSDLVGKVDAAAVRQVIDVIYPAFEVLEVRGDIVGQKALAIADNAATKDIVLGEPATFDQSMDLASLRCRFWLNDGEAVEGRGADVLGDPLNAVSWLSEKLSQFGLGLRRGELIMTGSLTSPVALSPGDHAWADFGNLGKISVILAA